MGRLLIAKVFARKIVRALGSFAKDNILTESQGIEKVTKGGGHANIIRIISTVDLTDEFGYLRIDMELCSFNLDDYIHHENGLPQAIRTLFRLLPAFLDNPPSSVTHLYYGLDIFRQICSGLDFIHRLGLAHRDMKPQNSKLCRINELTF